LVPQEGLEPTTHAFFSHSMKAFSSLKFSAKFMFLVCPFLVGFNRNLKERLPTFSIGTK
jgi:hypothetical protein